MKIKKLIIMIVLLLACVGVSKGQYTFKQLITADGVYDSSFDDYVVTFGDDFFVKYGVKVTNRNAGGSVEDVDPSKTQFEFYDGTGKKLSNKDIRKLSIGKYTFKLYYGGNAIIGGISSKKLTIIPRELSLTLPSTFYGVYNGTQTFKLSDFSTVDGGSLDDFISGSSINNRELPDFDETTQIDWDNTTFVFKSSADASDNLQDIDINWQIKSSDASVDWTSNYVVKPSEGKGIIHPRDLTAKIIITNRLYDGTTSITESQYGSITLDGLLNSDANDVYASRNGKGFYDSPEVGTHNNIEVPIKLSGSKSGNYRCDKAYGTSERWFDQTSGCRRGEHSIRHIVRI